jgi:hypothetical protein
VLLVLTLLLVLLGLLMCGELRGVLEPPMMRRFNAALADSVSVWEGFCCEFAFRGDFG